MGWFSGRYKRTKEGLEKVKEAQKRGVAGRLEKKRKFIGPIRFSSPQEKYRKTHPERIAQIQKKWLQANREKARENVRKQRAKRLIKLRAEPARARARQLASDPTSFTSRQIRMGTGRQVSTGSRSRTWDKRIQERKARNIRQDLAETERVKQYRSDRGWQTCTACGRRMKPHLWRLKCKNCEPVRTVD